MWKSIIYFSIISVTFAGIIHDHHDFEEHSHHEPIEETDHHHKVEHEHATSHQSFKIHHFHPVPVYVKKEDQHLLKHPIEVSGVKHKLKLIHPETEKHHHGDGIVLENHTEEKDHKSYGHYEHHDHHDQHDHHDHHDHHEHQEHHFEPIIHHDFGHDSGHDHDHHELSHHQFHDINVHHGHGHHE